MAALYRYFASKDTLIGELQRRVVTVLDRKLAAGGRRSVDAAIAEAACSSERRRIGPTWADCRRGRRILRRSCALGPRRHSDCSASPSATHAD